MKIMIPLLAAVLALGQIAATSDAQTHHRIRHKHKPKNEITKLEKARHEDHTTRQVTPDPKKSPGKHTDNLSKNVNHEVNRESKDFNHGVNNLSKGVNHAFQGKKKKH
jgi:hypothetical protein